MNKKQLKILSDKRSDLIGSLMSLMEKQVKENQKKTLDRIIEKFVDKLDKDEDGNVKNNAHNRKLLNQIDEVFKDYQKAEARTTLQLLLTSVSSIMQFNQEYFVALDGKARVLPMMPKVKDFMKTWLGIKGDTVEPNGYIDKLISNDPAKIALKNTAMKIVIGQEGFEDAKKQIKILVEGNPETMGAFEKHQKNFAFDLYSQIDRATSDVVRNDLGFEFAVYEGGIIESSRIFCEEHDGKIFHITEIKKFNPKEAKPPNYNPITDLGGFGCRHHLNWISNALAKAMGKDVENFEKQTKKTEEKTTKKEEPKTEEKKKEKTLSESEKQAIEDYVSGDGMWVNSWLRKKQFDLNKDEKNYIDKLDKATSNPLNEETTLFRSVDAKAIFGDLESSEFESLKSVLIYDSKQSFDVKIANKILEKINIGDTKTEKGFMSSTRSEKKASEWGGFSGSEMPIIMKMQTSKDTKGIDLSNHKMEQEEVLLKRNQQYEIGKIYSKNGNIFVDVKLL